MIVPHNDYLLPPSMWNATTVVDPSMLRRLDQTLSEAIDGDNGGVWTPSSPIIVGGAGLQTTIAGLAAGGVTTGPNAKTGGAVIFDPGNNPGFVANTRARALVMHLRNYYKRRDEFSPFDTVNQWYDEATAGSIATATQPAGGIAFGGTPPGTTYFVMPVPPRFIHATGILSLTLRFHVGQKPVVLPQNMPGFRISKVTASGAYAGDGYVAPFWAAGTYAVDAVVIPAAPNGRQFRATVGGATGGAQPAGFAGPPAVGSTIADGAVSWQTEIGPTTTFGHYFTLPRPSTIAAYYAQGQTQDIVMLINQASLMSTPQANVFAIDIFDVSGTSNVFHSVKFNYNAIAISTPPY